MEKVPHGILFGDKHTWRDWKIVPTSRPSFSPPEPNRILQEVPGRNGAVDLSTALTGGIMTYKNRSASWEFHVANKRKWQEVYSEIMNTVHGERLRIVLDDDPQFFYDAFVKVNDWKSEEFDSKIVIDVDAHPYKFKNEKTIVTASVSGQKDITLNNLKMPVVPEVTCNAEFKLLFGNYTTTIRSGTHVIPDLLLLQGPNKIRCIGTGQITIKYQEGGF